MGCAFYALDTAEISKAIQALAILKMELDRTSEVRTKKVKTSLNRIQKGFYDTKEVVKELAEILLKEFKASSLDLLHEHDRKKSTDKKT